jgi:hypothetical protein
LDKNWLNISIYEIVIKFYMSKDSFKYYYHLYVIWFCTVFSGKLATMATGHAHWSEIRLDNASIVYKSEARSHRPPPDSGAPLLYRFVLQTVVFRVFCLGYVSDQADFTITTIEAYKKNFEQKIWSIMAL